MSEPNSSLVPLGRPPAVPAMNRGLIKSLEQHLASLGDELTDAERAALAGWLNQIETRALSPRRPPALAALAEEPPEAVLTPAEMEVVAQLLAKPVPAATGLRSNLVVILKATRLCNLRCTYCRFWAEGPNQKMTFDVLARAIHGAMSAPEVQQAEFVWHGGETTLLPIDFYRKALWLQERLRRPGQRVINAIQTNGTNLTPAWLDFLKDFAFQVGVSLDGPPEINDRRRLDVKGRATSQRIREGLAALSAHGIEHGILMVVDDDVIELGAERLLHYFLETGIDKVALLNVIPDNDAEPLTASAPYLHYPRYVEFSRELFRLWWPAHKDRIYFREMNDLLRRVGGDRNGLCIFQGNCMGGYLTVEPNGDVAACDKYLGDQDYRFANLLVDDLSLLTSGTKFLNAHSLTGQGVERAQPCPWFQVCHGGCPHDRYLRDRKEIHHDEHCCGLAPLLSDMTEALKRHSPSSPGLG